MIQDESRLTNPHNAVGGCLLPIGYGHTLYEERVTVRYVKHETAAFPHDTVAGKRRVHDSAAFTRSV